MLLLLREWGFAGQAVMAGAWWVFLCQKAQLMKSWTRSQRATSGGHEAGVAYGVQGQNVALFVLKVKVQRVTTEGVAWYCFGSVASACLPGPSSAVKAICRCWHVVPEVCTLFQGKCGYGAVCGSTCVVYKSWFAATLASICVQTPHISSHLLAVLWSSVPCRQ